MDLIRRRAAFWTILALSACKPAKSDLRTPLTGPNDYTVPLTSAITPPEKPGPLAVTTGGGCQNTPVFHVSERDHEFFEGAIGNYRQLGLYDKSDPSNCFPCIDRGPKFSAKNTGDIPFAIPKNVEVIEVRIRNCVSYPVDPEGQTAEKCGPIYAQYLDNKYGNVSDKMRRLLSAYATLQQETRDKCLKASQNSYAALSKVGIEGLSPSVSEADGRSNMVGNRVHNLAHSGQVMCELLSQPEFTDVREEADLDSQSPVDWTVTTLLAAAGISTIASAVSSHKVVQTRAAAEQEKRAAVDKVQREQRERVNQIEKLDEAISQETDERTRAALRAHQAKLDYEKRLVEYNEAVEAHKAAVSQANAARIKLDQQIREVEEEIAGLESEAGRVTDSIESTETTTRTTVEKLSREKSVTETRKTELERIRDKYKTNLDDLRTKVANYSQAVVDLEVMPKPTGKEDLRNMDTGPFDGLIKLYEDATDHVHKVSERIAADSHQAQKDRLGLLLDKAVVFATDADGNVDDAAALRGFYERAKEGAGKVPEGFVLGKNSVADVRKGIADLPQPTFSDVDSPTALRNQIQKIELDLREQGKLKTSEVDIAALEREVAAAEGALSKAQEATTNPALDDARAKGQALAAKIGPFGEIGIDDKQSIFKSFKNMVEPRGKVGLTDFDRIMFEASFLLSDNQTGLFTGVLFELKKEHATSASGEEIENLWEWQRQTLAPTDEDLNLAQKTWAEIKFDAYLEALGRSPLRFHKARTAAAKAEIASKAEQELDKLLKGPPKPNENQVAVAEKGYKEKLVKRGVIHNALYKHLAYRAQTDVRDHLNNVKKYLPDSAVKTNLIEEIEGFLRKLPDQGIVQKLELRPFGKVSVNDLLKKELRLFTEIRNDIGVGNLDRSKFYDPEAFETFWKGFQDRSDEIGRAARLLKNAEASQDQLDEGLKKWQASRKAIETDLLPLKGIVENISDPALKAKIQKVVSVDFTEVDGAERALDDAIAVARAAGPVADPKAVSAAQAKLDEARGKLADGQRAEEARKARDAAIEKKKAELAEARQRLADASDQQRAKLIEEAQEQLKNLIALEDAVRADGRQLQQDIQAITMQITEFEKEIKTTTETHTTETSRLAAEQTDLGEKIAAKRVQLAKLQTELAALKPPGDTPIRPDQAVAPTYDDARLQALTKQRDALKKLGTPDADAQIKQIDADIQARVTRYRNYGLAAGIAAGALAAGAAVRTYQNQRELDERYAPANPDSSEGLGLTGAQNLEQTKLDVSYQLGLELQETAQELSKAKRALGVLRLLEEELCAEEQP